MQTVEEALKLYGAPIYVRKQIVHNKHVVATLEAQGAIFVEENEEVPEGATVVFSAHGVAPEVYDQARARSLRAIDATCPLVTKVHHEAKRFAAEDYDILLIGHEGHEEVIGTSGEAPAHIQLVDGPDSVDRRGRARSGQGGVAVPDDAVGRRDDGDRRPAQAASAAAAVAPERRHLLRDLQSAARRQGDRAECDVVIVVGSTNSSNSVRLREVALDAGARAAYLVDYRVEIDEDWLDGATHGRPVPRARACPTTWSWRCWTTSPERASTRWPR